MKASKRERKQAAQNRWKRTQDQARKQNYFCTAEHDTNLILQVVHSSALGVISVVLCEDVVHGALKVPAYLDAHRQPCV